MNKSRFSLLALLFAVSLGMLFLSNQPERSALADDEAEAESVDVDRVEEEEDEEAEHELETLGRTIRLEFKLEPLDDDDTPRSVLVATPEFELNVDYTNPDIHFDFEVGGELLPVEEEDKNLLLIFHSTLGYSGENEAEEAIFNAKGSTFLALDKPVKLTLLGEKTLTVTATEMK